MATKLDDTMFFKLKNSLFLMYLQSIHLTTEAHISSVSRFILAPNFINPLKKLPAACHKLSLSPLKKIKGSEHFAKKIVNYFIISICTILYEKS